ncbi:hypothetical protein GQ53DRAFT_806317 [Thozetella sp. PMI_491]|nr:hypothetical protein GQ53DRAFT_806317 [Thozetella sp. PMI_491]
MARNRGSLAAMLAPATTIRHLLDAPLKKATTYQVPIRTRDHNVTGRPRPWQELRCRFWYHAALASVTTPLALLKSGWGQANYEAHPTEEKVAAVLYRTNICRPRQAPKRPHSALRMPAGSFGGTAPSGFCISCPVRDGIPHYAFRIRGAILTAKLDFSPPPSIPVRAFVSLGVTYPRGLASKDAPRHHLPLQPPYTSGQGQGTANPAAWSAHPEPESATFEPSGSPSFTTAPSSKALTIRRAGPNILPPRRLVDGTQRERDHPRGT